MSKKKTVRAKVILAAALVLLILLTVNTVLAVCKENSHDDNRKFIITNDIGRAEG